MDVSQDGSLLAAGGQSGLVEVWELSDSAARQLTVLAGHDSRVEFLSFDATASHLATSAIGEETRVWDVSAHGRSEWATLEARTATFSSDGKHLALAGPGRDVSVLDVEEWDSVVEMHEAAPYVTERNDSAWATGITFSPDGKTVATASHSFDQSEGLLQLWSFSTGQLLRALSNSTEPSGSIAFSPDGTRLAAAVCLAGSPAQVWDVASGALVFEVPSDGCGQAVDLGPGGRLLSVQIADTVDNVQVWDIDTGQRTIPSISHLPNFLGSAELSPDGDRLLTAGGDGRARVWDVDSGESSLRLEGHAGAVERAVWSPDGGTIATGDAAGAVRLWNATTGDLKLSLRGHTAMVVGLSYSPDGRRLASTDGDGTVRVWANDIDDLIQLASDRLTRGLTEAECASYHFDECPLQP
jgi:WD40 repeat protein